MALRNNPDAVSFQFPGLNGLRFFSAMAVLITHVELIKGVFGLKSFWKNTLVFNLGGIGVYFFFVLSGFLITYLLLAEKHTSGNISIKKFYLRRILRIWPLYFLILVLGFFVLPNFLSLKIQYLEKDFTDHFGTNLILYLIILPNLAYSFFNAVPHIGQMWSIGVEEQFYIFWPLLVKYSKKLLNVLIGVFFLLIVIKVTYILLPQTVQSQWWYLPFKRFLAMTKMELMAVGGIGAYFLFFKNEKFLKAIYNPFVQVISVLLVPLLVYIVPEKLQDGVHIIYSAVFLVIIINCAANPKSFIKLNHKWLDALGNVSYGIYMYHLMLIPITLTLLKPFLPDEVVKQNIIIYVSVIINTIGVSLLSYHYFEKPFVKLKRRFQVVKT